MQPGRRQASGRPTPKLGTMAKTPDEMMSAVSGSLAERTGKTMDKWVALVQASGIDPLEIGRASCRERVYSGV